jgi:hypothetical protein
MNALDFIPGGNLVRVIAVACVVSAVSAATAWFIHHEREIGRNEVRAEWTAEKLAQRNADLTQAESNAKETLRRLTRQQENQRAQDVQLAAARAAADRNGRDADQLRVQNVAVAQRWRDALRDSPTGSVSEAAGDAIGVLADVLGRADRRAGILAAYADAAHAAGLKCERDYDALTVAP